MQGAITRREFAKAMASMRVDASAEELEAAFDEFDLDGSGAISYAELEHALRPSRTGFHGAGGGSNTQGQGSGGASASPVGLPPSLLKAQTQERAARRERLAHAPFSNKAPSKVISAIDPSQPIAEQLKQLLLGQMKRVIDLFREMDTNHDNAISHAEFVKAMDHLGVRVGEDIEELWGEMDKDGSGEITYHELLAALDPSHATANPTEQALDPNSKSTWHYGIDDAQHAAKLIERPLEDKGAYALEHAPPGRRVGKMPKSSAKRGVGGGGGGEPMSSLLQELQDAFSRLAYTRVLDAFRAWDVDEDGMVTQAELAKAMTSLGLHVMADQLVELFEHLDVDGSGAISYLELKGGLQRRK